MGVRRGGRNGHLPQGGQYGHLLVDLGVRGVTRLNSPLGKKQVWRPPSSNLTSFESKCTFRNKRHSVSAPGYCDHLPPPRYATTGCLGLMIKILV